MYKTEYDEEDLSINEFLKELVLKTLMENSTDSIYFKDTESRFLYVNKIKAQKHDAKDPSEMVGKSDYDYLPGKNSR